jgi:putative phosphoribosyl transferase
MFRNRAEAGRRLAEELDAYAGDPDLVVVGLPRGGVPVAFEVALALDAPLDVIVVRKLGVPHQPELGMGAIGEDGVRVLNEEVVRLAGVARRDIDAVEARERTELERRAERFRGGRARVALAGRVVLVVDDGIATGSTARAACQVARAEGAARVVLAAPVAPAEWTARLAGEADEFVCVANPEPFYAVGQFYDDFSQTTDEEVVTCLRRVAAARSARAPVVASARGTEPFDGDVLMEVASVRLEGHLTVPEAAPGIVVFVHGSGSSRHSPRNRFVASVLQEAGLATLLFDLLTPEEELARANVFDIDLLSERLAAVTAWLGQRAGTATLPIGLFGASTGAAAALRVAAGSGRRVAAVVSRGGRPDLAGPWLEQVRTPTLLVVGGEDRAVLGLNREAGARLGGERSLVVVPGATHLFEEPGTLRSAAESARDWFLAHLQSGA